MIKTIAKRFLALALMLVLLLGILPATELPGTNLIVIPAYAAQITSGSGTWINDKLTYTYTVESNGTSANGAAGTVSPSGDTLTVTATNSKEVSGCSTTAAEATTTTVTVTNASSYPLKITTLTTTGSASVSGVSQGDTIASGATFKVTVTAPAVSSSTAVSGTVTIAVEEKNSVNITLASSTYVGYTVGGHTVAQNGSSVTFESTVGASISLPSITAPSGYEFKHWKVGNNTVANGGSFTADADYTVFPVIVTAGTDTNAANFKVGSATYTFWEDAMTAAVSGGGTVFVNLEDVTLPTNVLDNLLPASGGTYVKPIAGGGVEYILPAGVTLVVPYSTSTTVHTTTPAYGYKQRVAPSPFRTLTVPNGAKITVNGSVSVDSYVCAYGQSNQGNGTPSGPHGKIVMKSGSEMTFNSGANLYCYGYINGDGNLYMNSGAKVYELFQFCDWRGGNGTNNINGNSQRVFPMSQYYVQNVEAPMTIYKGATEYVWSAVNMSSSAYPTSQIEFIGTNGMFKLTGGSTDYVMKRYHANVDRLEITAHGDMTLNNLTVKVSGLPLIGSITMNSNAYVLPINNMNIVIESGTTSIASSQTYGVEFLPSSKLTVNEGATFSANAPVYFYDAEDWGGYCGASNLKLVVSGYSTANGTTAIRTADNLKDAELDVNGTVNVGNKLYTTEHGAHITSSEGTGVINFTTACATGTATTHQATQSGTDISYVDITVNNAWLQNGDESYSKTVSTGTSTWKYDKPGEHWYRYLVDFNFNNNLIARDYYCEIDDTVTYDASWLTDLGASVTSGTATAAIDGTNVNVTGVTVDSVVTLTGTPAEYIPTFVLSEEEYTKHYLLYNPSAPLSDTTTINGETYYIVDQADSALAVGTAYAAPTDADMGVTEANHNTITWNMSGLSATSGDPYRGTVPAGETAGGPVYIYGFYTGVVAHNSWNDQYYDTLIGAFEVLPQDVSATITLLADCGTFEEESGTVAYTAYTANNIILDLNGHHALGRIVNSGTFTLELNGGTLDYHTGAEAAAATYNGMAAVINSGTMTIQDSVGGGKITTDAISNDSGANGSAVIRNNAGGTLTVTGKDAEHLLPLEHTQNVNANNYGIFNLGTIAALTNVDISTANSGTGGINLYNYNTGVVTLISGGHMFCASNCSIFNYGGTIGTIDGLTIDGKYGIVNRNIATGSLAAGLAVTDANKGIIDTIQNCHIEVGQYAIHNHAVINTLSNSTFIAHPDSAQVDTRGNGTTASEGNVQCYTVVNNNDWWYNTNVWKQVDSSSGGYTRVNYYKEEEEYRPRIGTITNCEIYAEITSNSASHGYALVNYGVINTIGGTTNIKTYKHSSNGLTSFSTGHYTLHNLNGGIIKSIEGTVNISATGVGTVYNDGQFTLQNNYTYANKVAGNITYQKNTYGEPSTIQSITCSGTWSCGGGSSLYYALMNSGYIGTINSTGLKLTGGYNVLYNATGSANTMYEITKKYTDGATASTEYERDTHYVKNLTKGSSIGTINGITVTVKGTKVYQGINNQGHIGTLSNVTVGFADGATNNTSSYPLVLNGDSRYAEYTETILTNRTSETDPHLTVTAGVVTRYDRDYTYTEPPTIDVIDNLTVTSIGTYAFRNAGHIGTLKNSTITGTQYALHNYANGPYTERQTRQYYSGTGIFTTSKNASELNKHYKRNPAMIDLIDNCTITTPANTYAMFNSGHVGTIKNSTIQAGTTTAKAYALANSNSQEREYTRDLETILYVTANSSTACTAYYGSGGESDVVTYDYDAPVIDLIGEGNTFKATTTVIANTGIITAIDSGEGELTTITGSAARGSTIYNYSACLDARTTTTPYTAAASAGASGTAGTATNADTLLPGARIGTIKNVYINANGYGILNGDGKTGKLPVIGEIGKGTEIYAHCTTKNYHAIANQNYAEITQITGGIFRVTAGNSSTPTNAYRNGYNVEGNTEHATVISGGYFQGMPATRDNAIFKPDNTDRQTYTAGKNLSTNPTTPTPVQTDTMTGSYYYIADAYTVTFDMQGHGTAPDPITGIESGQPIPAAKVPADPEESGWVFGGWYTDTTFKTQFNFNMAITTENFTVTDGTITAYAKWTVALRNPSAADFTVENNEATYDGTTKAATVTGQTGMGTITVKYYQNGGEVTTPTNAGTYTVKVDVAEGSAYNAANGLEVGTLTINKKTIGLTWGEDMFTYNGSSQAPTATATGVVSGDTIGVTVSGAQTNAGTHTATASGLTGDKAGNYALPESRTYAFTIAPAAMTVTATGYTGTYDGQPHSITVTVTAPDGATVTYRTSQAEEYTNKNPEFTDVSETTVWYKVEKANYTTVTGSAKVAISKADPEVTPPTAIENLVYNGGAQTLIGAGTTTGGTLKYSLDGTTFSEELPTGTNAGEYTVHYKVDGNDNYNNIDVDSITVTIGQREVGLAWSNTEFTYDGKNHVPTATVTGTVNDDEIGVTVTGAASAAGTYTATASGLTGDKAGNYKLPTNKTQTFTITANHNLTEHPAVAATCTAAGNSAYWSCDHCGKYFSDADGEHEIEENSWVIAATGHTVAAAVEENRVEATCAEAGHYDEVVYCAVCGAELSREAKTIAALGHDLVHHDAKAATCTENGWKAYDTCSRCDYTTYEEIPDLGHTPAEAVRENEVPATCTAEGSYDEVVYCSVCGEELSCETKTISALGHTSADPVVENKTGTCTTGIHYDRVVYCSVCGEELSREKIDVPAGQHHWIRETTQAPTCTDTGIETRTCEICGEVEWRVLSINTNTHAWGEGEVTTEPTCTEDGVMTYTCEHDHGHTRTEAIPATGHTPGEAVRENEIAATCTEIGIYDVVVYCTQCDAELSRETVTVDPLGHDFHKTGRTAACEEDGVVTFECSRCEESYTVPLQKLGHSYGEPTYVWSEDNSIVTATVVCAHDHSHVITETVTTTCTDTTYTATFENEHFSTQTKTVNPYDDSYSYRTPTYTWSDDNTSVTATVTGTRTVSDSDIEEGTTEETTVSETVDTTYAIAVPATCAAAGTGVYAVSFASSLFADQTKTVEIERLTEHSYGDPVVSKESTCTVPSVKTYICEHCGHSYSESIDPLGHDFSGDDQPTWIWADDYSTATAIFTCKNDPSHTESVEATVTAGIVIVTEDEQEVKKLQLTATVTFGETEYTDEKKIDPDENLKVVKLTNLTGDKTRAEVKVNGVAIGSAADGENQIQMLIESNGIFTVTCEVACVIAWTDESGGYHRLEAARSEGEEDTYSFQIPITELDEKLEIVVAVAGDINMDGTADAKDATQILRVYAELRDATELERLVSDINCDRQVDAKDATQVLRLYAGLRTAAETW